MTKVILITGASSGIGLSTAKRFHESGWRVFGTTRNLANAIDIGIEWLQMDVHSEASVATAIDALMTEMGQIDVLFNNAGVAMLGAIEETADVEARRLFDTNVFGLLNVTRAVLPIMRNQNYGKIIFMSSLSGLFSVPYHGIYSATKHAVEAIAQALRVEVEPFGIRIAVIEPEAHNTGISMLTPTSTVAAYNKPRDSVGEIIENQIKTGRNPICIANQVLKIAESHGMLFRFPTGAKAPFLAIIGKISPDSFLHFLVKRAFNGEIEIS